MGTLTRPKRSILEQGGSTAKDGCPGQLTMGTRHQRRRQPNTGPRPGPRTLARDLENGENLTQTPGRSDRSSRSSPRRRDAEGTYSTTRTKTSQSSRPLLREEMLFAAAEIHVDGPTAMPRGLGASRTTDIRPTATWWPLEGHPRAADRSASGCSDSSTSTRQLSGSSGATRRVRRHRATSSTSERSWADSPLERS